MALATLVAVSGPKKSRFSGPSSSNDPCNGCCSHQNHYVPCHINNRYIFGSVADQGCLSRIRLFPSRIPDPHQRISVFNPKKWFLSSRKYDPGCSSRIPDPDLQHWFLAREAEKENTVSDLVWVCWGLAGLWRSCDVGNLLNPQVAGHHRVGSRWDIFCWKIIKWAKIWHY